MEVLIDTGASMSLMLEEVATKIGLRGKINKNLKKSIRTASSAFMENLGMLKVELKMGKCVLRYANLVVKLLPQGVLLGMDVLEAMEAVIDCKKLCITVKGNICIPFLKENLLEEKQVLVCEEVVLSLHTEQCI